MFTRMSRILSLYLAAAASSMAVAQPASEPPRSPASQVAHQKEAGIPDNLSLLRVYVTDGTPQNRPVPGVTVTVRPAGRQSESSRYAPNPPYLSGFGYLTNDDGRVWLQLPPGTYALWLRTPGNFQTQEMHLDVRGGSQCEARFVCPPELRSPNRGRIAFEVLPAQASAEPLFLVGVPLVFVPSEDTQELGWTYLSDMKLLTLDGRVYDYRGDSSWAIRLRPDLAASAALEWPAGRYQVGSLKLYRVSRRQTDEKSGGGPKKGVLYGLVVTHKYAQGTGPLVEVVAGDTASCTIRLPEPFLTKIAEGIPSPDGAAQTAPASQHRP
jgi:hypothetical protein